MKPRLVMVVLAGGLLLAAGAARPAQPGRDLDTLQGTWTQVFAIEDGQMVAEQAARSRSLTISGNRFTFADNGRTVAQGTVELHARQQPPAIDFRFTEGPDAGKVQMGIFGWESNTLRLCLAPAGHSRPADFASTRGTGLTLAYYQPRR